MKLVVIRLLESVHGHLAKVRRNGVVKVAVHRVLGFRSSECGWWNHDHGLTALVLKVHSVADVIVIIVVFLGVVVGR